MREWGQRRRGIGECCKRISNPGGFRIEIDVARSGGISDPRNSAMLKMSNLIDIGERAGSGIPNIYHVWESQGWKEPSIIEGFEPECITLALSVEKIGDKKTSIKENMKTQIIKFLTDHLTAKMSEITESIGLKPSRTRDYMRELISEEIVVAEGANRNRTYRLKA